MAHSDMIAFTQAHLIRSHILSICPELRLCSISHIPLLPTLFPPSMHQRVVELLDWVLANNIQDSIYKCFHSNKFSLDRAILASLIIECYHDVVGDPIELNSRDPAMKLENARKSIQALRDHIAITGVRGVKTDYTKILETQFLQYIS